MKKDQRMRLSEEIFFSLRGQWQLDRSMDEQGRMKGIASFSLFDEDDPFTFFYREEGEHTLEDGATFSFFKEYLYCLCQPYLEVYFTQNHKKMDLFHRIAFLGNRTDRQATGQHYCGKDIYVATYQFFGPDRFMLQYQVYGPKKNFRIQTVFQR